MRAGSTHPAPEGRRFAPVSRACLALFAAGALGAALAGCGRSSSTAGEGRGVLLIAVDSLRADHLTGLGYDRETTPTLDRLASDGISFRQNFTTGPWLLPAHVSVLSGCDPSIALRYLPENIHPSVVTLWNVPAEAPRLAREFLANGFATAAFADHPWTSGKGLEVGFQEFFECRLEKALDLHDVGIEKLAQRLENWLQEQPAQQDWFAYLHLHDLERAWSESEPRWDTYFEPRPELDAVPPIGARAHAFHSIPRRHWRGGLLTLGQYEAQYDGAIRRLDGHLDRLFSRLGQIERWEETTVAVVGTYGLGLGEGGIYLDHGLMADVDLRVPWIVRPAASIPCERGVLVSAISSLVDVGPTLLDLVNIDAPGDMQGLSQAGVLLGRVDKARDFAVARCGFQSGYAVMGERYCYSKTMPWVVRDRDLAISWYGTLNHVEEPHEVLHDRVANPAEIGHFKPSDPTDPAELALVEQLRGAGEAWIQRSEKLRQRWQNVTWPTPLSPSWGGEQLVTGGSPGSPP